MSGHSLGFVEGWVVTRDGETIAGPFENGDDAFAWIQKHQSQSWDWAIRYEGYDVVNVRDGQVVYSYKRDDLPGQRSSAPEMGAIELIELGEGGPIEDVYGDPDLGEFIPEAHASESSFLGAKVKKRTPLSKAKKIITKVKRELRPLADALVVAGSVRRKRPEVGDIEFVLLPNDWDWENPAVFEDLAKELAERGYDVGPSIRKATKMVEGVKVEIYIAHHEIEMGAMMFMYTGDRQFNIAMRQKAKGRGYLLNQYGIWTRDKKKALLQSPDERDFFEFLEVPYHTPAERSLRHRTPEQRRKAAARTGDRMGMLADTEEAYFSRLESVWDDEEGAYE